MKIVAGLLALQIFSPLTTASRYIESSLIKSRASKTEFSGIFNLKATDIIGQYGEDLVAKAKEGKVQEITGREYEINCLIRALCIGRNPCIVGQSELDRTALIEELAVKIAKGEVPDNVKNWQIIKVDMPSLVEHDSSGIFRLRVLLEYAKKHPNVIVFIDKLDYIVRFVDLFKTYLNTNSVKLVTEATPKECDWYFSRDPALAHRFPIIFIEKSDI